MKVCKYLENVSAFITKVITNMSVAVPNENGRKKRKEKKTITKRNKKRKNNLIGKIEKPRNDQC